MATECDKCAACGGQHPADTPVPKPTGNAIRGLMFAIPISLVLWYGIATLLPTALRAVGGSGDG